MAQDKTTKDQVLRARISADQKAALGKVAFEQGLDLSTWVRQTLLREAGLLPAAKKKA